MGDINRDPSMEEILASIKRVIAEDGDAAPAQPRAQRGSGRAKADPQDDVLELSNPVTEEGGLISSDAAEASRHSLSTLATMRERGEIAPVPGDGPLDAVVREMLKPMLKEWLDQRLPEMVEELVAREIARITGKPL